MYENQHNYGGYLSNRARTTEENKGKPIKTKGSYFRFSVVFLCFFDGNMVGTRGSRTVPPVGFYLSFARTDTDNNKNKNKKKKKQNNNNNINENTIQ